MKKYTFFYGSKLPANKILLLGYLWLNKVPNSSALSLTGFSQNTITDFYKHFRILVSSTIEEAHTVIGGLGVIVEIDETKLGKGKYNRGLRVEGAWVVCGIERTDHRRVFMVHVETRNSQTLIEIIQKYVAERSIVYTDMWKGYWAINHKTDMQHEMVNHKKHFKDPSTGVHTNTVEGTNFALKSRY